MILLAIDTAGIDCAVALCDSQTGAILAEMTETIGKGHAERLMAILDAVLAEARRDLSDVDKIAVTVGPGSFTGIRVGVAAARGLGLALGVPVTGVTTLEVMARAGRAGGAGKIAAIDAKRGEVYLQAFDDNDSPLSEPLLLGLAEAVDFARKHPSFPVVGSGLAALFPDKNVEPAPDRFPISLVARIGLHSGRDPKPLYLRGPDAKPQDGFAVTRA